MAKVSTVRLGAYPADLTLEFFEEEGYVKYKDLDKYFEECYCEFETSLSKEDFIRISKASLLRSSKYKEFLNDKIKMCSKCAKDKPLSSFSNSKQSADGKFCYCKKCMREYQLKWHYEADYNREYYAQVKKDYQKNNRERLNEIKRNWQHNNKDIKRNMQRRFLMKAKLKELGCNADMSRDKLDRLISLKNEYNIKTYKEFYKRFEGVINAG